jgi:hypothetical protein
VEQNVLFSRECLSAIVCGLWSEAPRQKRWLSEWQSAQSFPNFAAHDQSCRSLASLDKEVPLESNLRNRCAFPVPFDRIDGLGAIGQPV